jgi:phage gpG-like protein
MAKQSLKQFQGKVKGWAKKYPNATYRGVVKAAEAVEKEAKKNIRTKLNRITGRLENSVESDVKRSPVSGKVFVNNKQQYKAQTHEHGETITTKKEDWLIFKIGGEWRRAKQVRIPARPFMGPALQKKRKEIRKIIARMIAARVYSGK